jgi:hypothetical protein
VSVTFRPAVLANVNLLIGLAGASGSGKTYTGMRLASGIAGDKPFAVIDTENGRASHYAQQFKFDVADLQPPFTPARYAEAIKAADEAGYPVILVDSMSHEHAGDGGILDMQEAEFERMGRMDSKKMLSWAKPKAQHKAMMQVVLRTRAHLILCFRAEAKIDMVKQGEKTVIVPKQSLTSIDGWIPICEKTVPFELTASFLLMPDHPGVPKPIKLQQQHRALFPLDKSITEESGKGIAAWAAGGSAPIVDYLGMIALCMTRAELETVKERVGASAKSIDPALLAKIKAALQGKIAAFKAQREESTALSFETLRDAITTATTAEALQLAIDQIGAAPEDRRAELMEIADKKLGG